MSDLWDELFGDKKEGEDVPFGYSNYIGRANYQRMTEQRVKPTEAPIRRDGRMVGEWDPEIL